MSSAIFYRKSDVVNNFLYKIGYRHRFSIEKFMPQQCPIENLISSIIFHKKIYVDNDFLKKNLCRQQFSLEILILSAILIKRLCRQPFLIKTLMSSTILYTKFDVGIEFL